MKCKWCENEAVHDGVCNECLVKSMNVSILQTAQVHAHQYPEQEASIIQQSKERIEDVLAGKEPRHKQIWDWANYLYSAGI